MPTVFGRWGTASDHSDSGRSPVSLEVEAIEAELGEEMNIEAFKIIDRTDGEALARVEWAELTDDRREALEAALEEGYFEVPRRIDLVELADQLDISDSALSQRLRRGITTVLADHVPDSNRKLDGE